MTSQTISTPLAARPLQPRDAVNAKVEIVVPELEHGTKKGPKLIERRAGRCHCNHYSMVVSERDKRPRKEGVSLAVFQFLRQAPTTHGQSVGN